MNGKCCDDCIYEHEEYKKAIEKAKLICPELFMKQAELEKTKELHRKKLLVGGIVGFITLLELLVASILKVFGLFLDYVRWMGNIGLFIFVLVLIYLSFLEKKDAEFWDDMARKEYELYKLQKEVFKKVGYELP